MESSFATFSQSNNNSSSSPPPLALSDMEYYAFHHIDRTLFRRLIGSQGHRDPKEAIQIMGFWIWLEREVVDNLTLIKKMLELQMTLVNNLCNETVMCLRCVASEKYPFSDNVQLALMPIFVQRDVSFKYFYENRVWVVKGVAKMVKEVCARAFRDILEEYNRGKEVVYDGIQNVTPFMMPTVTTTGKDTNEGVQNQAFITPPLMTPSLEGTDDNGDLSFFSNIEFGTFSNSNSLIGQPAVGVQKNPYQGGYGYWYPYYVAQPTTMQTQSPELSGIGASAFMINTTAAAPHGFFGTHENMFKPSYAAIEPSEIKQDVSDGINDFNNIFNSSLTLIEHDDDSPDERTIFLTFSRGYPISAAEVKEFFTKKFGNFIEGIHMQEVPEDEQVLFARVIACSPAFVNAVCEGGRAKYSINGKHVWARKYVRNKKSPPPPPEVAGPSTCPVVFGAL
ncbi:OLC1v1025921C1 [Oldenlandia corymbosa var. corymbosa]|uniref:OLC1v1025921C1 n=1 Tax=Oldenlandia corymbosa var. corymbosa TaxID=529605 RepID=A0AAV1C7X2_OLDCO|nr:OLC1v1025921C1 [Oldenlandia corymbosa var. corymbosa]